MATHLRNGLFLLLFTAPLFSPLASIAQSDDEISALKQQMQLLMQRVEALEERNAELETQLQSQDTVIRQTDERIDVMATQVESTQSNVEGLAETKADQDKVLSSKYGAEFYGYVKLDGSYDTSRIFNGNYALYVESEENNRNDDQSTITANQTRFGFNLRGPDVWGAKSSGKVEGGFYGGGAENKSRFRMRHVYGQLEWPDYDLAVLAGQTWDLISPLYPKTLNFLIGDAAGNIAYRRAQLRVTKGFATTETTRLEAAAALTRTIGQDQLGVDTGTDSGFPTVQGRLGYSFPLLTDSDTTFGISGHYGEEEFDTSAFGDFCVHDTWSISADLTLPLMEKLLLTGELFHGKNLDTFYGGILQGVNRDTAEEIPSAGGWVNLAFGPWHRTTFNLGYSMEDPEDEYVESEGRTRNSSLFGNIKYDINEQIMLGLEVSYWETDYKDISDGDALRFQTSVVYKF